jgi:hypothetical protein
MNDLGRRSHEDGAILLSSDVHNEYAEIVFNLGEIGIREWQDRTETRGSVPSTMRGQMIYHGIHGNLQNMSLVAWGTYHLPGNISCHSLFVHKLMTLWRKDSKQRDSEWVSMDYFSDVTGET